MKRQSWLWSAHPVRSLVEAWALALLILVGLYAAREALPQVLNSGLFFMCGAAGTWAVFRTRLPEGSVQRRATVEIGTATALGVGMACLQVLAEPMGLVDAWNPRNLSPLTVTLVLACTGAGYLACRVLVAIWLAWDRLRRRHMRWALTHAHLMLVVLAAAAVALAVSIFLPLSATAAVAAAEKHGVLAGLITRFLMNVFPALTIMTILTAVALVVILPPAALFSYFAVRQTTRRLESLTAATAALRAGAYGARVSVVGEDELAQLQTDFNAMADTLQGTLSDLQNERDQVARLLLARRQLVANVSHELRTPVATASAVLESLLDHWDRVAAGDAQHDVEIVAGEMLRLRRLIDDLFALSRAEVGALSLVLAPVDAGQALRQMADAAAPLAWQAGRVEVQADIPADLPAVRADGERFRQVVANLLRNAVRYTAPGGIVVLAAVLDDSKGAGGHDAGWVRIDVRDTGPGIAAEDLPRIWDRFYRGSGAGMGPESTGGIEDGAAGQAVIDRERQYDGAGLGLALVKELTEAMGGRVAVESVPGLGSCFSVWLPVSS